MGGTAQESTADAIGLMPDSVDPDLHLQNPGAREGPASGAPLSLLDPSTLDEFADSYLEVIRDRLQGFVDDNDLAKTVSVDKEKDGVFLRMESGALFGSGEAALRPEAREVLRYLSQITRELNVGVVVAGHADNQPIRDGRFASNWELSAARAAGVARYLVMDGHPPTRIKVESYGEFQPIADNETPEGRARNRRVELFYSREDIREAATRWAGGQ
jgi:chemotaxis protein MotB